MKRWCRHVFLLALALAPPGVIAGPHALVSTDLGNIAGVEQNDGLAVFRGIPYARPPVAELRWRPPQPAVPWADTLDASRFGHFCPQNLRPLYSEEVLSTDRMSEDCLTLNIWTPEPRPGAGLPVMVWITPGSFRVGSAQMPRYDGSALARQGVVLVTFDYRIGLLGQFAHPTLSKAQRGEALGNYGLMDQLAALRWVQKHIAGFGGDPDNVTVFGMSAGGVSVNYLMTMPAAKGLFHRAISQSSGIRVGKPRRLHRDEPGLPSLERDGVALAQHFGLQDDRLAEQVRTLAVEQILAYQGNPALLRPGSLNPVVDGTLVTESVGQVFLEGRQHPVPYIAGATDWEGSLVAFLRAADVLLDSFGISRMEAREIYGEIPEASLVQALEGDFFFGSQRYLVKQHAAAGNPSWLYLFRRVPSAHLGQLPGAAHGAESRYVFQTLDSLTRVPQRGYGQVIQPADRAYAAQVSALWVRFAKSGNPGDSWPGFSADHDWLMEFGQDTFEPKEGYEPGRMRLFERLFEEGKL